MKISMGSHSVCSSCLWSNSTGRKPAASSLNCWRSLGRRVSAALRGALPPRASPSNTISPISVGDVKARYYSPQISRVLVCALYHEAQRQRKPMTRLTDELLFAALRRSIGFRMARARFITSHPAALLSSFSVSSTGIGDSIMGNRGALNPFRPIPTGLRPPAQGWRSGAYLG